MADGQNVQRRRQHADPFRARHRVEVDVRLRNSGKDEVLENTDNERRAEYQFALAGNTGQNLRVRYADGESGQHQEEAGEGAGYGDIEQDALRIDGRADAD